MCGKFFGFGGVLCITHRIDEKILDMVELVKRRNLRQNVTFFGQGHHVTFMRNVGTLVISMVGENTHLLQ